MQHFEAVRSYLGSRYKLQRDDPYLISFDLAFRRGRAQSMYLAELEDEAGHHCLRISTPVGPLSGLDPTRCLRFNWSQRAGFLAVEDLDGEAYLHLCENRPYPSFDGAGLERLLVDLGTQGDQLESIIARSDTL